MPRPKFLPLITFLILAVLLTACQTLARQTVYPGPGPYPIPTTYPGPGPTNLPPTLTLFPTQLPIGTPGTVTPPPTLTPFITQTPAGTQTPTLTPTLQYTLTPSPTLFVLPGTPLPPSLVPITAANAGQVSALAEWQLPAVTDLAWTPDSAQLAVSTTDRVNIYDPLTRDLTRTLYPTTKDIIGITFSPDYFGTWLAVGTRRGSEKDGFGSAIELWRGPDWQPRGILAGSPRGLNDLMFSPNGKALATVYTSPLQSENVIEFLNTSTWVISSTLQTGTVLNITFSPNSAFMVTTPDRYAVKVWDLHKRALAFKFLTAFTDAVQTMVYSPDGTMLATGSYDGNIQLWDMKNGTLIRSMRSPAAVQSLAFSPDGSVLAAGSVFQDNNIRLYSVSSSELLRELEGNTEGVTNLLFSPDGRMLVSASYNGRVMLWGVRP